MSGSAEAESARAVSEAALDGAAATEDAAAELDDAVESVFLHALVERTTPGTTIATASIGNRRFILITFFLGPDVTLDLTPGGRNFT